MVTLIWDYEEEYHFQLHDPIEPPTPAKKEDEVSPKKETCNTSNTVSCDGFLADEKEYAVVKAMADVQMRQWWGKDIDHID